MMTNTSRDTAEGVGFGLAIQEGMGLSPDTQEGVCFTRTIHMCGVSMQAICFDNRVPPAGKTRARLNAVEKSRRRPNAVLSWEPWALGPLTAAGGPGLAARFS
jgi:hypothetical protein